MHSSNTKADGAAYTTTPIESDPEFTTVPGAQWRFSLGRSTIYEGIASGEIESVCLRREGKSRGRRLLRVESIRRWLASMPTGIDKALSRHCRKANAAMRKKKKEKENA
jgi:hypothetical protein